MADISKIHINPTGGDHNIKDATARNAIQSSKTLKSSVVTVTDAAPINAEDITVDITPKQDLHGYDKPWAGGAGKNKLPMTVDGIKALNTAGTWSGNVYDYRGVTAEILTDNDNNVTEIKLNGTTSDEFNFFLIASNCYSYNGMILNGCPSGGSIYTYNIRFELRQSPWAIYAADNGTGASIANIPSDDGKVRCFIRVNTNISVSNLTFTPMIRLATETDATFAPYSNECPLEGRTGAELDRVGKNWLNYDDNTSGYNNQRCSSSIINNEIIITATGTDCYIGQLNTAYSDAYFAISPCIEGDVLKLVVSDNRFSKNYVTFFNKNNEIVGASDIYLNNFTVPNGAVKMGFRIGYELSVSGTTYRLKAMVVKSTETDPTYEPYQGQQYTANFGETVHGGKWHVTDGGTDKVMGIILASQFNVFQTNPSAGGLNYAEAEGTGAKADGYGLCSIGEVDNINAWNATVPTAQISPSTAGRIRFYCDATSLNDFKTKYTDLQIVYELATPTTISTPKQNVPMLQGINTVYADCGDTSLKYQPDNVIGELKGEIEDVIDYAEPKFVNYSSYPHDTDPETAFGVNVRLRRDRGYVSIENVALTFWQNYPIADFYYEIQNPVPTEFIPEYDVEKLFLHINGQSFLNVILTNTGILKLRMYSPVRIVDNYPNVFWLQSADETGCKDAKY